MIKAILFDFAGVIATDSHQIWLKEKVPDIEKQRQYFQVLDDQADKGTITNQELVQRLSERTGVVSEKIWPEHFALTTMNTELLSYIKTLKQTYKIGLLSNYTYEWLEKLIAKYHLAQYFDSIYISSRYGMIKPEEGAFRKALKLLNVAPQEAIFTDDRQGHVDAANSLGIRSFLYTSLKQLKQDLKSIGVTG